MDELAGDGNDNIEIKFFKLSDRDGMEVMPMSLASKTKWHLPNDRLSTVIVNYVTIDTVSNLIGWHGSLRQSEENIMTMWETMLATVPATIVGITMLVIVGKALDKRIDDTNKGI